MSTDGLPMYSRRFHAWMQERGLSGDPFALYEAERELYEEEPGTPVLSFFFVGRPYLYRVIGQSTSPQTAFLMADRGGGKSATRAMVAYQGRYGRLRRRVLIVNYTDFGLLLDQVDRQIDRISPRHHVRAVLRCALKAVAQAIPPDVLISLPPIHRQILAAYAAEFADPITCVQLAQLFPGSSAALPWEQMSPLEILAGFAELTPHLGRDAIYVLIDRVDEQVETATSPDAAAAMLRPLVEQQPLLDMRWLAFKFFLPSEVGQRLRDWVHIRQDRVYWHTVTWDAEALRKMIQARLFYYSGQRIASPEALFDESARDTAVDRLIQASAGSPRTLLRLFDELLHHHVSKSDLLLIDLSDVTEMLADVQNQPWQEGAPTASLPRPQTPPPETALPHPDLCIDENGRVWVDGHELPQSLSPLEFTLLQEMYDRPNYIFSREDLIRRVWGPLGETGTETTLRKLISRLRKKLAAGDKKAESRFIENIPRQGYSLRR